MTDCLRVREIDDDEGQRLMRVIRRGGEPVDGATIRLDAYDHPLL